MKRFRLTLMAALLSSFALCAQQSDVIGGSYSCKATYPSGNKYLMDSCRVDFKYKLVMGSPSYIANAVWHGRNEFVYENKKVEKTDVAKYTDLNRKFNSIAPTKAVFKFTVLFYSSKLKSYIASAKTSMELPYLEVADATYSPKIQTSGRWREMFKDVVIGKQEKNNVGAIIPNAEVDNFYKTNNVTTGKKDSKVMKNGYGRALRTAFLNSDRIDVVDVTMDLTWPTETYAYIVNELERIGKVSACLAKNDTAGAAQIYFSDRNSLPLVKTTSVDFWKTTVTPYDLYDSYIESANKLYQKGDYNNAAVYYNKVLFLDSTDQYAASRLAKIKLYQASKNVRNVGNLELIYVKGDELRGIKSFYIGKTEVTRSQWNRVMGTNTYNPNECRNCPITGITWDEAMAFCKKLSEQTGMKYYLPSSKEWEYAANGGLQSSDTEFSGSNNIDEVAWTVYNSEESVHPVAEKQPNELGIYDMTGNVSEYVNDIFDKDTRIQKGGSFEDEAANCAISGNKQRNVKYKGKSVGFRVCQVE